jgi:hypothetical protein
MPTESDTSSAVRGTTRNLTVGQLWEWLSSDGVSDHLLDWAPDIAALTTVLLERSQAFRFVVSPPVGAAWPPGPDGHFTSTVSGAAEEWCRLMARGADGAPEVVHRLWNTVEEHLATPVAEIACGRPWPMCEAVLLLNAIADEASAGCGGAGRGPAASAIHRARAQELLVRTGTMSRLPVERVALLPKTRTTQVGMTHRSLSRYTCATTGGIPTVWHRAPIGAIAGEPQERHANSLLLPWPLRIRESDFEAVPGSVRRPERQPFGFFSYSPSEPLDLELVDRLLEAALEEVDRVDVVALPEGTLHESDVPGLEAVLARWHVPLLVGGLRIDPVSPEGLPGNGVHIGICLGGDWWHYRQNKHHRWYLDAGQVEQYNLAGALHPSVRWWEAMEIPQRAVHVFELRGGLTVAAVVCEDLARLDGVAELLRALAPTLVLALLLDGPQLASRWTSRYAGVLADDPGSAVLTLTSFGMAVRSRPAGMPLSGVIAMWKDPVRGIREIALDPAAQGVLLKSVHGPASRFAADGRMPVDDATDLYVAGVHQLRDEGGAERPGPPHNIDVREPPLDTTELSTLYSWVEAVGHALVTVKSRHQDVEPVPSVTGERAGSSLDDVLAAARAGAPWRRALGLPEPSAQLNGALDVLDRISRTLLERATSARYDALTAALESCPEDDRVGQLVHRLLHTSLDVARG